MTENLQEKVQEYFERIRNPSSSYESAKNYSPEENGLWQSMSGTSDEYGRRSHGSFYDGRFIDAVAQLVESPNHFGFFASGVNNGNNGYLKKIIPIQLKPKFFEKEVRYVVKKMEIKIEE